MIQKPNRIWDDYSWSKHALLRICEYRQPLHEVFTNFEQAIEVEKDEMDIMLDLLKRGGKQSTKRKLIATDSFLFVLSNTGNVVITVVFTKEYKELIKAKKAALPKNSKFTVITREDGTKKLVPRKD